MDFMSSLDFFTSPDGIICLVVGAILGALAGQIMKGRGFGLVGNMVIGALGAVISGLLFDWINIIDVGDVADPVIAGGVGAIIVLAIGAAIRRQDSPQLQG